jgi:hypothetical protein
MIYSYKEDYNKIVRLGTGKKFGDHIIDMENLFIIEPITIEVHSNIVSRLNDESSDISITTNIK